jgi:GT2 family glycosyltransferase
MFMLLRTTVFRQLGGFDDRYFLYYEDVDLCARIRLSGLDILQLPLPGVIHNAQRSSHRNPKYLRWHIGSMLRFFCSSVFIRALWLRRR